MQIPLLRFLKMKMRRIIIIISGPWLSIFSLKVSHRPTKIQVQLYLFCAKLLSTESMTAIFKFSVSRFISQFHHNVCIWDFDTLACGTIHTVTVIPLTLLKAYPKKYQLFWVLRVLDRFVLILVICQDFLSNRWNLLLFLVAGRLLFWGKINIWWLGVPQNENN